MPQIESSGIFCSNTNLIMKIKSVFFILVLLSDFLVSAQIVGPKNGKLMIVGGGAANPLI